MPTEPKTLRDPDAARRFAEIVALHQTVLTKDEILAKRFIAVRLADGGTDGVCYDTRESAILASGNSPSRCGYFQIPLERWSAATCDTLLWYVRANYDSGFREDPSHQLIISNNLENMR